MKKLSHMLIGVVVGALVATAGSAAAAQISMIGKKVTGEYTVKVNGKTLTDKGSVIDGRANVPVRALSDALGANLAIEGRTIIVSTDEEKSAPSASEPAEQSNATSGNKYANYTKGSLLELKASIENNTLKLGTEGREALLAEIETLKKAFDNPDLTLKQNELANYERIITEATEELRLINEALATK